jgi:hypothetical protein
VTDHNDPLAAKAGMPRQGGSLKVTYRNQCHGISQQWACKSPLDASHGVQEP